LFYYFWNWICHQSFLAFPILDLLADQRTIAKAFSLTRSSMDFSLMLTNGVVTENIGSFIWIILECAFIGLIVFCSFCISIFFKLKNTSNP
jgi:hypothetical protein